MYEANPGEIDCALSPAYSIERSEIELNRTQSNLSLIEFGNRTKSNIEFCVRNRTQSNSIEFGHQTQSNTIQLTEFDWVRLSNFLCVCSISFDRVRLTMPGLS